jgi:thioredoxin-related protein
MIQTLYLRTRRRLVQALLSGLIVLGAGGLSVGRADDTRRTDITGITWVDYERGRALARERGRPLLLAFHADWCRYCRKMEEETYTDPAVIAYLEQHFVSAWIDTEEEPEIAQRYHVRGLPTIWFLTSEGELITNLPGYVDAPTFLKVLAYIATGAYETQTFPDFLGNGSE